MTVDVKRLNWNSSLQYIYLAKLQRRELTIKTYACTKTNANIMRSSSTSKLSQPAHELPLTIVTSSPQIPRGPSNGSPPLLSGDRPPSSPFHNFQPIPPTAMASPGVNVRPVPNPSFPNPPTFPHPYLPHPANNTVLSRSSAGPLSAPESSTAYTGNPCSRRNPKSMR